MKNVKNLKIVFLLTNLAFQALIGQYGIYSITKPVMAKARNYDESFLGRFQALQLISQIIGSLALLFITIKPTKGLLFFCSLNMFSSMMLIVTRYIKNEALINALVITGYCSVYFCLASLAYTQIIFSHYFNDDAKKFENSIWYGFTFLGDIISLLFAQALIRKLGIDWEYIQPLWALYILVVSVALQFYLGSEFEKQHQTAQIDEILDSEQSPNQEQGQKGYEQLKQAQAHNQLAPSTHQPHSLGDCLKLFKKILTILKQKNIFLLALSFGLSQTIYFSLIYWLPYYYNQINHPQFSTLSALACCVSIFVGVFVFEITLFQFCNLEKYSRLICYVFLIIFTLAYYGIWMSRFSQPIIQIMLLMVGNFFLSSPYSRILSADPIEQSENNPHKIKIVFLLGHLSTDIMSAICQILIGQVMKIDSNNFWHVIMAVIALFFMIETYRKLCLKKVNQNQVTHWN